jgi:high-affinity iron transporter
VDLGAFTSGLLIGLREGVEAALIVAIILAYLSRVGGRRWFGRIWLGVGVAVAVSTGLGLALFVTVGGLQEPYEQLFEGLTMLLAAGVVTWMLFWMRRQAGNVSGELQSAVDRALTTGSVWGLSVLAFMAVIREGVETSLFLVGTTQAVGTGTRGGPLSLLIGALVGLGVAAVMGYGFYRGSRRINLRTFFRVTGVLLVFIAAGLVSHAAHEFVEIGVINVGTQTLFDVSGVLTSTSGLGEFLGALFGYSSQPEVITFVVWLAYLATVLPLFLRPVRAPQASMTTRVEGVTPAS